MTNRLLVTLDNITTFITEHNCQVCPYQCTEFCVLTWYTSRILVMSR